MKKPFTTEDTKDHKGVAKDLFGLCVPEAFMVFNPRGKFGALRCYSNCTTAYASKLVLVVTPIVTLNIYLNRISIE
jgi:hypothetical protein